LPQISVLSASPQKGVLTLTAVGYYFQAMDVKTLFKCFMRTYLMGGAFNTRGLQNVGLIYALDPALRRIYPEGKSLQRARKRHVRLYNSHPFWNPLLLGIFIYLEGETAKGLLPEGTIGKVKSTVVYTLSAIGDSFFGGSLLVTWALGTMLLWFSGYKVAAWTVTGSAFLFLQVFKVYVFYMGLTRGIAFLNRLRSWNLINWGAAIKLFNAVLLLILVFVLWPRGAGTPAFLAFAPGIAGYAYAVFRLPALREFLIAVAFAVGMVIFSF